MKVPLYKGEHRGGVPHKGAYKEISEKDAESSVRHMNRGIDKMARNARSLPTGHREVTLTEFRASIGGVTASDKPKHGSEKMPAL